MGIWGGAWIINWQKVACVHSLIAKLLDILEKREVLAIFESAKLTF